VLHVGSREFEDNLLDAAFGSVTALGLEYAWREDLSGFGVEVGLFGSSEQGAVSGELDGQLLGAPNDVPFAAGVDGDLIELMLGSRYTLAAEDRPFEAFVGGGLNVVRVDVDGSVSGEGLGALSVDDSETSVGGYLHLGFLARAAEHLAFGVDVRRTVGVEALDSDLDHLTLSVMVGLHF
jgi:hypothetical protein